jgi:hypothetical protein
VSLIIIITRKTQIKEEKVVLFDCLVLHFQMLSGALYFLFFLYFTVPVSHAWMIIINFGYFSLTWVMPSSNFNIN